MRSYNNLKTFFSYAIIGGLLTVVACSGTDKITQPDASAEPITDTDSLLAYQDEITTEFLHEHLAVLAADSMKGRETGKPGQKMAARYIVEQYQKMELQPVGDNGTFLQKFKVISDRPDSLVFTTYKETDKGYTPIGHSVSSKNSSASYIRAFGGSDTLDAEIVFAGFGVNDPAQNIHHLQGMDLQDKWVMVFQSIPYTAAGDTLISPTIDRRSRLQMILKQGAAGILLIPNMSSQQFEQVSMRARQTYGKTSGMRLAYRDDEGSPQAGLNIVNPVLAAEILGVEEGVSGLKEMQQQLIQSITEFQAKNTGYRLQHIPYATQIELETENIAALLKGANPQVSDEVVVLSAHYDHVGVGQPDSTGDAIYNGADDDGSGTSGLLNVAYALTQARENGVRPRRSIL
ncbi:MAG TPA: M28 family peptidase, partial [Fodinibius sp.]|nr:M28 family peptidase [Fodinibius sp.]